MCLSLCQEKACVLGSPAKLIDIVEKHLSREAKLKSSVTLEEEAEECSISYAETAQVIDVWKDEYGTQKMFVGKVSELNGASATVLAMPENFEAFFWRTRGNVAKLQVGEKVEFTVGFNAHGLLAHIIRSLK